MPLSEVSSVLAVVWVLLLAAPGALGESIPPIATTVAPSAPPVASLVATAVPVALSTQASASPDCLGMMQSIASAVRGSFQSTNNGSLGLLNYPSGAVYVLWQMGGGEQFSFPINAAQTSDICGWANAVAAPSYNIGGMGFGTPIANCGGLAAFTTCLMTRNQYAGMVGVQWCTVPGHAFVVSQCADSTGTHSYVVDSWQGTASLCQQADCSDVYNSLSCTNSFPGPAAVVPPAPTYVATPGAPSSGARCVCNVTCNGIFIFGSRNRTLTFLGDPPELCTNDQKQSFAYDSCANDRTTVNTFSCNYVSQ